MSQQSKLKSSSKGLLAISISVPRRSGNSVGALSVSCALFGRLSAYYAGHGVAHPRDRCGDHATTVILEECQAAAVPNSVGQLNRPLNVGWMQTPGSRSIKDR